MRRLMTILTGVLLGLAGHGQAVSLTSSPYTQNFDSMGAAGTTPPSGWTFIALTGGGGSTWTTSILGSGVVGGTPNAVLTASTTYTPNSATFGFNYALAASPSDRSLGIAPTSVQGGLLEFTVTNGTGSSLNSVKVGYDLRRFTVSGADNELPGYWLFYSLDGGTSWNSVSALNPVISGTSGVVVPNTTGVTTVPLTTISLSSSWAAGSTLLLRWVDDNSSNASPDQIMGLDNVTVMAGTATQGAAPTVALTAPTASDSFAPPATIDLAATASDSDGTITRVEFYNGSVKLGEDASAPYTYHWTGVTAATYILTARAVDNLGNVTTSSPVNCFVEPPVSSGSLVRGPYLQMAAPTRMTIRWRTTQGVRGRVKFGTSVGALNTSVDEPAATTEHEVDLTGLTPATTYFYNIGSTTTVLVGGDANHTFTTPPTAGTVLDTRIWVLGDAGLEGADQIAVRDAFYNWTGSRTPNLVLQLGDNAYSWGSDSDYQRVVFNTFGGMMRKTPFWSALGNHETSFSTSYVDTYDYFSMYTLPKAGECGGTASGTEHYYSFNYSNIHFVCLDSMTASRAPSGPMLTWLQGDLAATTATWIIAYFHHAPYTKGSHLSDSEADLTEVRQNILPVLEAGGVDLVLCGHSHSYERSYLLDGHYGASSTLTNAMKVNAGDGRTQGNGAYTKPLTGPRSHRGAVYVVAGSASLAAGGPLNHPAMFISLNNLGSFVLDVNGPQLNATFLRDNSSVPDTFSIRKQDGADTDGDGMPDEWEIANSLNRNSAADAALDGDGDGMTNLQECIAGTDPRQPGSKLSAVVAWTSTPGQAAITFTAQVGKTYTVRYKNALSDPSWTVLTQIPAGATSTSVTTTDTPSAGTKKRYYQVVTPSTP